MESYKDKFYRNPAVNPYTGRKIQKGKDTYNKLVKEFGDPYLITVLNSGNYELNEDILYNIILYASPKDLPKLCSLHNMTHKLCQQNIWKTKFDMDNIPSPKNIYTIKEYLKMIDIINDVNFIIYRYKTHMLMGYSDYFIVYMNKYHKLTGDEKEDFIFLINLIYNNPDMEITEEIRGADRTYFNKRSLRLKHIQRDLSIKGRKIYANILLNEYNKFLNI